MRYEYVKEDDRWIDHADAITKAKEAEYFEERKKEKERCARIAEKIKTLVVTNKEDYISYLMKNLISSVILQIVNL